MLNKYKLTGFDSINNDLLNLARSKFQMLNNSMKTISCVVILVVVSGLLSCVCLGQASNSESALFATDSILELTLFADLDSLLAYTEEEPDYQSARLMYKDPGNQKMVEMNVKVRSRGNFRRKPEHCGFPPLKMKFYKSERQGTIFEDLKDVKLVTHCQTDIQEYEQYVLEEYLIYKAYNIFTDFSFKVRLARITYLDEISWADTLTRYAFILENAEHMAKRNNCELLELETVPPEKLDRNLFTLMSLFNYMILNTDYSVPIVHNVELVIHDHFSPPIPVPYDFDWSGIINIPYESPFAATKAKFSGRQYKGPCINRNELERSFSVMLAKREQLFNLYRDFPYLDEDMRSRSLQDLSMFFIIITSRELIRQEFIKNCED